MRDGESESATRPEELARLRRSYLWILYTLVVLAGLFAGLPETDSEGILAILSLAVGVAIALLVATDARLAGKPLPWTAFWVVFFLWPIAAPACLIGARKLRGLGYTVAHAALLFAAYAVPGWLIRRLVL